MTHYKLMYRESCTPRHFNRHFSLRFLFKFNTLYKVKVPIPFTDWKVVVGGEAAYGSIGGEAKLGLMNEIDVGLGIVGIKFGVEKG